MVNSRRIIFFGNERLATGVTTKVPLLKALVHEGYEVAAVVTNYTPGISRTQKSLEIVDVAQAYHIPVLMPDNPIDIADKLRDLGVQTAILAAYGRIVPETVLDIFRVGIVNIHPSLLPQYRGPTPIETAILDGALVTGVSLMKLVPEMDAGPIYAQQEINLAGNETKKSLADRLLDIGKDLLVKNLPKILDGSLEPKSQRETKISYTELLQKKDGVISLGLSAEQIERMVRAHANYPKSRVSINGRDVILTKVRIAQSAEDGDLVLFAKDSWIEILELTAPSGSTISGSEFLRGYSRK